MATCLFRRIVQPKTLEVFARSLRLASVQRVTSRCIHISPLAQRKFKGCQSLFTEIVLFEYEGRDCKCKMGGEKYISIMTDRELQTYIC